MKRIVLSILFLLAIAWGWNAMGERCALPETKTVRTEQDAGEATPYIDQILSVLAEANSFADISVGHNNTIPSNIVRKHRPGGVSFEQLFHYLTDDQELHSVNILKTSFDASQEYASRLKNTGYYIFALRKILI